MASDSSSSQRRGPVNAAGRAGATVVAAAAAAVLVLAIAGCAAGGAGSQRDPYAEVVGTWFGPAYPDDGSGSVEVTMVLEVVDGELVGRVSVPEQMMEGVRLENLAYEEGMLQCTVPMEDGMGGWIYISVRLVLEDEDTFGGYFDSEAVGGTMTLRKR
jgi:hypothetical protein